MRTLGNHTFSSARVRNMKTLIILVVSVAYIALCGASYNYPIPNSGVPLFNLNEATGRLEFNRAPLVTSSHTTAQTSKKEETSHHHHSTTTVHQTPPVAAQTVVPIVVEHPAVPVVVQHPTENVDTPFYESPLIVAENTDYEQNMALLQNLCAQRDVITTQIEHITQIEKTSTSLRVEQSGLMATLLRQREFLNFQINNLISFLGLETRYNTQFQVVGTTNQQTPQPQLPEAPQYVEKKILFFEPTSTVHAIYPPTPVKAQTFNLVSTESHTPVEHSTVLSALEDQRDMITAALSKLSTSQKEDKTNLVDFYTTRRDIIVAQIAQIKELQKGHTSTTTIDTSKPGVHHQNVETNVHSTDTTSTSGLSVSTTQHKYEETITHKPTKVETTTKSAPNTAFVEKPLGQQTATNQEADLLAVLTMIRDSLQTQIQLLVSNSKHREELGEDKETLLKTLKAECDVIDLQIAHAMGKFNTKLSTTTPKPASTTAEKVVETHTEHVHIPHEQFGISRRYLPTY